MFIHAEMMSTLLPSEMLLIFLGGVLIWGAGTTELTYRIH
jgi:hypothetical protein